MVLLASLTKSTPAPLAFFRKGPYSKSKSSVIFAFSRKCRNIRECNFFFEFHIGICRRRRRHFRKILLKKRIRSRKISFQTFALIMKQLHMFILYLYLQYSTVDKSQNGDSADCANILPTVTLPKIDGGGGGVDSKKKKKMKP
jgi:hypothetical protein